MLDLVVDFPSLPSRDLGDDDVRAVALVIPTVTSPYFGGDDKFRKALCKADDELYFNVIPITAVVHAVIYVRESLPRWQVQLQIRKLSTDEKNKYKKKNQLGMTEEEKEKYKMPTSDFFKSGQIEAGKSGLSVKGRRYYKEVRDSWLGLLKQVSVLTAVHDMIGYLTFYLSLIQEGWTVSWQSWRII